MKARKMTSTLLLAAVVALVGMAAASASELHAAAGAGDMAAVKALLAGGADPNTYTRAGDFTHFEKGETPLLSAIRYQ